MNWLLRLLPIGKDKRDLIEMVQRIVANLDTKEERRVVIDYGKQMLADGKVRPEEWAVFGKHLHIFKHEPPQRKGRPPKA